jgi:hypothetical protein
MRLKRRSLEQLLEGPRQLSAHRQAAASESRGV